jgi:hypothetical protein
LKFTPKLFRRVAGSQSDPHAEWYSLFLPAHADAISIPTTYLPSAGDHSRSVVDLIFSKDDHVLVMPDPFKGEKRSTPASPDRERIWPAIPNLKR